MSPVSQRNASLPLRLIALLLFVALGALASGQALPPGVTVNVSAGFDGYYKPGRWTPVVVSISNQPPGGSTGEEFRAQVVLRVTPAEDNVPDVQFFRTVSVPAVSTQQFHLYVKIPESPIAPPTLEIRAEGGRLLSTVPLNTQPLEGGRALFVQAGERGQIIPPILRGTLDYVTRAKVTSRSMPDQWIGFDSVDALIVPEWSDVAMRPDQQRAVTEWVAQGGTLVFLTGRATQTYTFSEDKDLLPAVVAETFTFVVGPDGEGMVATTLPKDAFGYTAARLEPKAGAETLMALPDGSPIVVRRRLGLGSVVMLAVDLDSAGERAFADRLARTWFAIMPAPNRTSGEETFAQTLRTRLTVLTGSLATPPNFFILIAIAIVYAIVVGPLNFGLLSRMKRIDLAWMTVPAIVVVFSVLLFQLGKLTRGAQTVVRNTGLRVLADGQNAGSFLTATSMFTPNQGELSFVPATPSIALSETARWHSERNLLPSANALAALGDASPLSSGAGDIRVKTETDRIAIESWPVNPYDVLLLTRRGPAAESGTFDSELETDGSRLTGVIANNSNINLDRACLVFGGAILPLAALKAGDTLPIDVPLPTVDAIRGQTELGSGWQRLREGFQVRTFAPSLLAGDKKEATEDLAADTSNAVQIFAAAFHPEPMSELMFPPHAGDLFLVGMRPSTFDGVAVPLEPDRNTGTELVVVRLNLLPRPGGVALIESAYNNKRLLGVSENTLVRFTELGEVQMAEGTLTMQFESPLDTPDAIFREIRLAVDARAAQDVRIRYTVFDHVEAKWVPIEPGASLTNDSNRFALPLKGRVFLRVALEKIPGMRANNWAGSQTTFTRIGIDYVVARREAP